MLQCRLGYTQSSRGELWSMTAWKQQDRCFYNVTSCLMRPRAVQCYCSIFDIRKTYNETYMPGPLSCHVMIGPADREHLHSGSKIDFRKKGKLNKPKKCTHKD
jgi:hypothetical protein